VSLKVKADRAGVCASVGEVCARMWEGKIMCVCVREREKERCKDRNI